MSEISKEKEKARSLANAAGFAGILGSGSFRLQFVEKREPTVFVDDTFICKIARYEVFIGKRKKTTTHSSRSRPSRRHIVRQA
jgi:hypothetical protein